MTPIGRQGARSNARESSPFDPVDSGASEIKAPASGVKKPSPCDVEALKKCLEENKGDRAKCQTQIEAFKSSCSLKGPPPLKPASS